MAVVEIAIPTISALFEKKGLRCDYAANEVQILSFLKYACYYQYFLPFKLIVDLRLSGHSLAWFVVFISQSLACSGLHNQIIVRKKRNSVLQIVAEMFDLAGGHTIGGTWRSHAPFGFASNSEREAKFFIVFFQTESLEQNFFCFFFKLRVWSKTFSVFASN